MKKYIFLVWVLTFIKSFAQDGDLNMSIIAHVQGNGSGIWHYLGKNGIEYAAMGYTDALVVYSLEDPSKPIERFRFPGVNTIWREVFFYGEYIYAVTDSKSDGVIIINMKQAPTKITGKFWSPTVTANNITKVLSTCHTVFVDEKGILSLNGCGDWRGVLLFDLKPNPEIPKFIGSETKRYCHDNFIRRDTMFTSDVYDGLLSIWNVKNPAAPVEMASVKTPAEFTHNAWPSDDNKYIFTTDERADAYVASFDISDFNNIRLLDKYRPKDTENQGVIPHNTRYINGYLVTAYYTDGVKIIDAHKPDNLVEVGSVDTYKGTGEGFRGCWGVSPYLPSGTIVASDIDGGFFVIKPNYVRACYLEGLVTDTITGLPISGAKIKLLTPRKHGDEADLKGIYKTGYATAGTYQAVFDSPDYFPKTVEVILKNGEITIKDVQLVPRRNLITQKVIVKDAKTLKVIEGASIAMFNSIWAVNGNTSIQGEALFPVYQDTILYKVVAGKWGYLHASIDFDSKQPSADIVVLLRKGYQDDFIFDQGWTVSGTAVAGKWERAEPIGTTYKNEIFAPELDLASDFGNQCYVTENRAGMAVDGDVDEGVTILTSPEMDLSTYNKPIITYYRWFGNAGGTGNPNDRMTINLSDGGVSVVPIEEITKNEPKWVFSGNKDVKLLITPSNKMKLILNISDDLPGHLLEGGLDGFLVIEGAPVTTQHINQDIELQALPVAFNHTCQIKFQNVDAFESATLSVINTNGVLVKSYPLNASQGHLIIGDSLAPGIYFAKIVSGNKQSKTIRLVKI